LSESSRRWCNGRNWQAPDSQTCKRRSHGGRHDAKRSAAGAKPLLLDALDRDAVVSALQNERPDAIVHELTAIPARFNIRHLDVSLLKPIVCVPRVPTISSLLHKPPRSDGSLHKAMPDGLMRVRVALSNLKRISSIPTRQPLFGKLLMPSVTWKQPCWGQQAWTASFFVMAVFMVLEPPSAKAAHLWKMSTDGVFP
jgi:hypothetical protein